MGGESSSAPAIRKMAPVDREQIVEIDLKVLGKPRPQYWEMKLDLVARRPEIAALVAEMDGKVVGFIIGGASRWEYGIPENVGWIDTIGVDPGYQKKGVAKVLFKAMTDELKKVGVTSMHTFVKRLDWKLLKFFDGLGFQEGDMTSLRLDL
jgi:GNAT superfamily N-acetyltransferase